MNLIRPKLNPIVDRFILGAPASRRRVGDGLAGETPALPGWGKSRKISARVLPCLRLLAASALMHAFAAAAQSTNAPAVTDYSSFRMIADQNIFDPNRFPHTTRTRRPSVSRSAPGFSLVGTMTYQNGMIAFFDGTESEYRKVLALNGSIAGYRVAAITLNSVKLTSTNKPVELAVGAQMRQEGGQWQMTGQGELPVSTADSETPAADPSSAPPSSGEANDVLKKLMEQREKELK